MSQSKMTQDEFRRMMRQKGRATSERALKGRDGSRQSRGHSKSEWQARFAQTPARTEAETADLPAQRALFEVHYQAQVTIRLPLPPSVNSYWRTFVQPGAKSATTYVSEEGKAYAEAVAAAWRRHFGGCPPEPLGGPLRLLVLVHYYNATEIDLDNRVKALQDALASAGVYANDCQIKDLRVREGAIVKPFGAVDVWISTMSEADVRRSDFATQGKP